MIKVPLRLIYSIGLKIGRCFQFLKIRSLAKKVGSNFHVYGRPTIINPKKLTLGDGVTLNHGVYINAFNEVTIGDDVTLSAGSKIISTGDVLKEWIKGQKSHLETEGLFIGNHVRVGANAVILSKANITGEYVYIAAGAVVTKPITDSHVVVGGVPAKIIKYL